MRTEQAQVHEPHEVEPTPTGARGDGERLRTGATVASTAAAQVWAVVVAGGSGTRFGGAKQYGDLAGHRVVDRSVAVARAHVDAVVLVVPATDVEACRADERVRADVVVAGGATRSESVRAGLAALGPAARHVLVHDAARPHPAHDTWRRVVDALQMGASAVVPAVPVVDSLRAIGGGAVDRSGLVAVQTPQGFAVDLLRRAHHDGAEGTDDASLVERLGVPVFLVDGDPANRKITDPIDLTIAAALLPEEERS